jgi:Fur family ferric uptake transcriptional regulator
MKKTTNSDTLEQPKLLDVPDHFDEALDQLKTYLDRYEKKYTLERALILKKLHQLSVPITIQKLGAMLAEDNHHISRATLYNTLQLFCEAGLVNRIDLTDSTSACYVRTVGLPPQMYVICKRCGTITTQQTPLLEEAIQNAVPKGFKVVQQAFHIEGLCARCQNTLNRAEQRRRAKKDKNHKINNQ